MSALSAALADSGLPHWAAALWAFAAHAVDAVIDHIREAPLWSAGVGGLTLAGALAFGGIRVVKPDAEPPSELLTDLPPRRLLGGRRRASVEDAVLDEAARDGFAQRAFDPYGGLRGAGRMDALHAALDEVEANPALSQRDKEERRAGLADLLRENIAEAPFPSRTRAPMDASAFCPRVLRRATPELIQVWLHQPKDAKRAAKGARLANPKATLTGVASGGLGVPIGAEIRIVLTAHGADIDVMEKTCIWTGEPTSASFPITPDAVPQLAVDIQILLDNAALGSIGFVRKVAGANSGAAAPAKAAAFKPVRSVFLSYSNKDVVEVAYIAGAYGRAGIDCFFDRSSIPDGAEYAPILFREIAKRELYLLCWSHNAAQSPWVVKEAEHAFKKRRWRAPPRPMVAIQMLSDPPWPPHPPSLDKYNFDDFQKAAVAAYAAGKRPAPPA